MMETPLALPYLELGEERFHSVRTKQSRNRNLKTRQQLSLILHEEDEDSVPRTEDCPTDA